MHHYQHFRGTLSNNRLRNGTSQLQQQTSILFTRFYPVTFTLNVYVAFIHSTCISQSGEGGDYFMRSEIKSGETDHQYTLINRFVALWYNLRTSLQVPLSVWYTTHSYTTSLYVTYYFHVLLMCAPLGVMWCATYAVSSNSLKLYSEKSLRMWPHDFALIHSLLALQPFFEPWPLFQSRDPIHNR